MTKNDFYELVMEAYKPAETLIRMVPADKLDWRPGPSGMDGDIPELDHVALHPSIVHDHTVMYESVLQMLGIQMVMKCQ